MKTTGASGFSLSAKPIDIAILTEALFDPAAGACVTFEGRVRNANEGRMVEWLEYEAYEAVAMKEGAKVIDEALSNRENIAVRCVHRVGHLAIGEIAVWIGVISAHRDEAFRVCRFVIDEVKGRVPIWKKEQYSDGSASWVENAG